MSAAASPETNGWWLLQGSVQGCGLRPAAAHYARQYGIGGWICNTAAGVVLCVQAHRSSQQQLIDWLTSRFGGTAVSLPPPAPAPKNDSREGLQPVAQDPVFEIRANSQITHLERQWLEAACRQLPAAIRPGPGIPRDLAICNECLLEVRNPTHRRSGYVLNSCVHCGPRYTVLSAMPWDRRRTALAVWPLCADCNEEYRSLQLRRGHAQIISCQGCGPRLWIRRKEPAPQTLQKLATLVKETATSAGDESRLVQYAAERLAAGAVIALQGIGGWQLVCDAGNSTAVCSLRTLKLRPHKPLAVMIPSAEFLETPLEPAALELLRSPVNPILLCHCRLLTPLAPEISEPLNSVGIFLPTTGLHDRLLQHLQRPLVVSSANLEDDPIMAEPEAVQSQFGTGVDLLLGHQRPILRPIDDSVVRVMAGRTSVLRLGRGLAPFPLPLTVNSPRAIVALGGQQKSSFAFAGDGRAVLGPHCGDLHSEAARERFVEQLEAALDLYQLTPAVLVHDMHPDYFTSIWARSQKLPTIAVQHHHAHAAAALLEAQIEGPALAAAFDGAGYAPDGVIRGGEFLIASRTSCQPAASLLTFELPAAELAARTPWRSAVAVLQVAAPEWNARTVAEWIATRPSAHRSGPPPAEKEIHQLQQVLAVRNGPHCSSMGRLFDALACLILGIHTAGFEGAAAIQLEEQAAAEDETPESEQLPSTEFLQALLPIVETSPPTIDWRPLVRTILAAAEQGRAGQYLARIVHFAIAEAVVTVARRFPTLPVALTGGCFQNRVLTERTAVRLQAAGRQCLLPGQIPINDAGLAAGQLTIAAAILESTLQT